SRIAGLRGSGFPVCLIQPDSQPDSEAALRGRPRGRTSMRRSNTSARPFPVRQAMLAFASALALGAAACGPQQQQAGAGQVDPNRAPNPNAAAAIASFLDTEINGLSVLDRAAQEAELTWFANAAAPYQGMDIK